jgi:hypothetical protein
MVYVLSANARVSSSEQIHLRLGRSLFFFPAVGVPPQFDIPELLDVLVQSGMLFALAPFACANTATRGAQRFRIRVALPIPWAVSRSVLAPNQPRSTIPLISASRSQPAHAFTKIGHEKSKA